MAKNNVTESCNPEHILKVTDPPFLLFIKAHVVHFCHFSNKEGMAQKQG